VQSVAIRVKMFMFSDTIVSSMVVIKPAVKAEGATVDKGFDVFGS
jgi:hypothetical protein